MGRHRASLRPALLLLLAASFCGTAVLFAAGQKQPVTVDGLTDEVAAPASSSSSSSMPAAAAPSTTAAATAAAPAPDPVTPSALAAPIDRAAFRTVATCSSLVQLPRSTSTSSRNKSSLLLRPSVKSLNATLEMDVTPSYSSVWRGRDGNAGGWRPGSSRLNISSLLLLSNAAGAGSSSPSSSSSPSLSVSARLHPLPCLPQGAALFGPLAYSASTAYRHNSEGTEAEAPDGQRAEILGLKVTSMKRKNAADAAAAAASSSTSTFQVAGSGTFPFLVDYDAAGSVVLYADESSGMGGDEETSSSVPLACCSLTPPPPDFPDEWSAVIEANVRDKGYTMVVRQLYSASNKKVRLDVHSLGNDRVVVQDYGAGTATFIDGPNATHPYGSCDVVKFDELAGGVDAGTASLGGGGEGGGGGSGEKAAAKAAATATTAKNSTNAADDGSAPVAPGFSSPSSSSSSSKNKQQNQKDAFLPTAAALAFAPGGGAARAKFLPSAAFDVRGIPVETWARRVEEPSTNSSYDLLYFFPVNAWLASGEEYHRLLKAIVVNGTQGGERVYQEFHFVDFRPYGNGKGDGGNGNGTGIPAEAFDPCEIAPGGAGCGCEKRKKKGGGGSGGGKTAAAAAEGFAAFPAGSGGGGVSSGGGERSFSPSLQQQQPMGFLPSQVGSYVFFLFLGLVAGLLGAFGVPALVNCCCGGRKRRSFGRFDKGNGAPPTSAVTSAA